MLESGETEKGDMVQPAGAQNGHWLEPAEGRFSRRPERDVPETDWRLAVPEQPIEAPESRSWLGIRTSSS